ncbi:MAG: trypsin-like peptidase domain-containing protein [bacterium]
MALAVLVAACEAPAPSSPGPPPAPPQSGPEVRVVPLQRADFSSVFERVAPSVVGIVAGRAVAGRFQAERTGTGIVWDAAGHIVTSDHLVADADEVRVRSLEGKVYRAKLVGDDGPTDVALLQIPPELPPLARGRSTELRPGRWVAAIGNPYGMDHSITVGVVSALGRRDLPPGGPRWRLHPGGSQRESGNSGGPLVDDQGRVVGITRR